MTPAFFSSSGDVLADRRYGFGRELAARGDLAAAADLFAQAAEIAPGFASAWFALGEARDKLSDRAGAAEAFARAAIADPQDRHGATLHLARLRGEAADMPAGYVRVLFDQYAPRFDTALAALDYRGPELLRAAVGGRRFRTMLDLGCGTGLAGEAFRADVGHLAGVDLSSEMVAQARSKGLYDRLTVDDLVPFLAGEPAGGADLIVAADVFVYLADLAPVVAAAARALAPDGLVAFTVEAHAGEGILLRDTLRFAHGEAHVRAALAQAGLMPLTLAPASTRSEAGVPVPGLVVVAKPA